MVGAVYLVAGISAMAFAPAPLADAHPGNVFLGFGADWLLTIVHTVVGLGGMLVAIAAPQVVQRVYGGALVIVFVGLVAFGIPVAANQGPDALFNVRWGNVVIYALTIVAGLYLAFGGPVRRRPIPRRRTRSGR